jgi:CheY-like chemotaxis protein
MDDDSILIVDDDVDQVSLLAIMLSNLPYPIITAFDGRRAVEILHHAIPALVITDMVLPEVSGSDIIQAIRADPRLHATKIIVVTSFLNYVSATDHVLVDKVLVKPVKKAELEQAINELMGS